MYFNHDFYRRKFAVAISPSLRGWVFTSYKTVKGLEFNSCYLDSCDIENVLLKYTLIHKDCVFSEEHSKI